MLKKSYTTGTPEIKLNGRRQKDIEDNVLEMSVDLAINLPDSFSLALNDPKLKLVDESRFSIGAKINIAIEPEAGGKPQTIFSGIITSLEPEFDNDSGGRLVLRGYDPSILLTQGKRFRTFLQCSDSDMIRKVAGAAGVKVRVDATHEKHPHTYQYNQTDWDFVMARAYRNGLILLWDCNREMLSVTAPTPSASTGVILSFGKSLRRFEPRYKGTGLPIKATARGWDGKQKQPVESTVTSSPAYQSIGLTAKPLRAMNDFVVDMTLASAGEAGDIAKMQLERQKALVARAEGECLGDPRLTPGKTVQIDEVGKRFSGQYYLTQARHEWDSERGYTTTFTSSGLEPDTLLGLLHPEDPELTMRIPGVVTALVTNNNDPDNLGQVKVKYPWMPRSEDGAEMESGWMRVSTPDAGANHGIFFFPEVDTEVLVAFEQGDLNAPVMIGCLWNGKDKPLLKATETSDQGKTRKRVMRSSSGHVIILDDTRGEEKITIVDKTQKNKIEIDSKKNALTIQTEGDMTFESKGKVSIKGKEMDISLQQDLTVNAQQKASFTAGGTGKMELASGGSKLQGAKVEISGQAQTSISGGMTSVKGSAVVEIQGALVKIN